MPQAQRRPTVSSNTLVLNEVGHVDDLIQNLLDAGVDEVVIVDGGSTDGTWERIREWSARCDKILPIQWPQRAGSEYKKGFNEVGRRNLMIEASSGDFILYIDADERVAPDFAGSIDPTSDCVILEFVHFWNGRIRVNSATDRVWSPDRKLRLFKRSRGFAYVTSDRNGLHNSLACRGIKIPLGYAHGAASAFAARLIRAGLRIKTGGLQHPSRLFHYHYYDLSRRKRNDLRAAEFSWPVQEAVPGTPCDRPGVVYVRDLSGDVEAQDVTRKYYHAPGMSPAARASGSP